MAEYVRVREKKLTELEKQFDFLEGLIVGINEGITGIKVKPKSEMPGGSALDYRYDSGYKYWTNVRNFGSVTVHEYWTKDQKGTEDVELVIYCEPGNEGLKIERLDALRSRYPFLEEIIAQENGSLFDIKEAVVNKSVLDTKCYFFSGDEPEEVSEQFYSVAGNDIQELGVINVPELREKKVKKPSPLVREELLSKGITPDFLVKAKSLKYEIEFKSHDDLTLTVYRAQIK